jgi:MFS superfamily sulfate permease-like transporter
VEIWTQRAQAEKAGEQSISRARAADLVDFLFIGVAAVPLVLAYAGDFGVALLAFAAMLVAACLGAAYFDSPARPAQHDETGSHFKSPPQC